MSPNPVPRTPKVLRRKLDRLARQAHAFHRYAHHPLCVEYAEERLRIGGIHLCRGCTLLVAGLFLGAGMALLLPAQLNTAAIVLGVSFALGLGSYRWRLGKVWARFLPGAGIAFAAFQGLRLEPLGWVLTLGSLVAFAAAFFLYRRRGPFRGPCETCPERDFRPTCRGYTPILRRERALQRLAGRMIGMRLRRE